jgi:hypothetical protein
VHSTVGKSSCRRHHRRRVTQRVLGAFAPARDGESRGTAGGVTAGGVTAGGSASLDVVVQLVVLVLELTDAGLHDVADRDDPARWPASSTTGRWRMRRSVIIAIRWSTVSSPLHVVTDVDIADDTSCPSVDAPCAARARTTSRSDTMPSIVWPSRLTTSAPTPWSRNDAVASPSVASGRSWRPRFP